jgi:serine/threonine protein kinase
VLQDRYRITQLLGQGGMGAIYLANDTRFSSKVCVVKEMLDHFHDPEQRETAKQNFYREADLLANLKHNAIPEVYDRFTETNRHYLVMEYINGTDLEVRINEQGTAFDEKTVVGWSIQVCDVMSYLHHQKPPIIYRDLKPANLILTDFGKVYLVDFGIARFFNPTARGTMIGTQGYAPPEQYRGQVEPRSDIFALGATMHYMLTNRDPQNEPPFSFPPVTSLNPSLSQEVESLISKCLDPEIDARFDSADALLIELMQIGGEESNAVRNCPHCARQISKGRQFCPHCRGYIAAHHLTTTHNQIHRAATATNLSIPTRKTLKAEGGKVFPKWLWAVGIGLVLLLSLGSWWFWQTNGKARTSHVETSSSPIGKEIRR